MAQPTRASTWRPTTILVCQSMLPSARSGVMHGSAKRDVVVVFIGDVGGRRGEKLSFKPVSSDYRIGLSPFGTDIEIYRAETGVRKAPIVRKSRPRDSAHST